MMIMEIWDFAYGHDRAPARGSGVSVVVVGVGTAVVLAVKPGAGWCVGG